MNNPGLFKDKKSWLAKKSYEQDFSDEESEAIIRVTNKQPLSSE